MPTISEYALIFKDRMQLFEEDLEIIDIADYLESKSFARLLQATGLTVWSGL